MKNDDNRPTLGRVIERFDRLWPNDMSETVKRRIIWRTDRAFAIETGQPEPEEYSVVTPKAKKLLIPAECDETYDYALLREASKMSEGAKEHYNERYLAAKKKAVATWRMIKKGEKNGPNLFGKKENL